MLDEEIDKWIFDFGHTGGMYISPSKIVLNPHEYLKSFIRSEIQSAVEAERRRISEDAAFIESHKAFHCRFDELVKIINQKK